MLWILVGLFMIWVVTCLGRRALSFFINPAPQDQAWALSAGIGYGILSYTILLLGMWKALTPNIFIFFFVMAGLVCLFKINNHPTRATQLASEICPKASKTGILIALLGILTLGISIAGVIAPDISNDSLCYHLQIPKMYAQSAEIRFIPLEFNSTFPFFMEMLYTLGLVFNSVTLAQFFHWFTAAIAGLSIVAFSRTRTNLSSAWMAALIFMTTPGIINEMPTTYVDVAQACFTGLSFFCCLEWITTKQKRWLVVSGIFSGFMLSIKFLALISILAQALLILFFAIRDRVGIKKTGSFLLAYGLPIFCCGGYWYIESWIQRGNPVFPYFYSIFKSGDPTIHYDDIGVKKNVFEFLKIFWTITMQPQRFEGYGIQIGPAYLMFLPLALKNIRRTPWLQATWLYTGIYLLCWFFLGQSLRFLFPLLPVAALLVAYALFSFSTSSRLTYGFRLLVIAVLGIHLGLATFHFRKEFKVALGLETPSTYLTRQERSYGIATYINQNLPPKAKIMNLGESHLFYFDREIIRESVYDFFKLYTVTPSNPFDLFKNLKREGFTHILFPINTSTEESIKNLTPLRLPRLLVERQNELAGLIKLLYTTSFTDPNTHKKTDYFLYQIL